MLIKVKRARDKVPAVYEVDNRGTSIAFIEGEIIISQHEKLPITLPFDLATDYVQAPYLRRAGRSAAK